MASITKRGPCQYQAQIRRKSYPNQQRTFETRREAEVWTTTIESEMHRSVFVDRSEAERTTFGEALERYAREVTASKRGWETEMHRINALKRHPLAVRSMASLRGADFAKLRDDRLKECNAATVKRELVIISHVFNTARKDWSLPVDTPSLVSANHQQGSTGNADSPRMSKSGCLRPRMKAKRERFCSCIILVLETGTIWSA